MENSTSTPINDSSSGTPSGPSSPVPEKNRSWTPPRTSPKNVGGDKSEETKSGDITKENKVISAS